MKNQSLLIKLTRKLAMLGVMFFALSAQANETEVIGLDFKGFIVQSTHELEMNGIISQLPGELKSLEWEVETLDEKDNVYHLIPSGDLSGIDQGEIWNATYKLRKSPTGEILEFDPFFEPNEDFASDESKFDKGDSYGGGDDEIPGNDGLFGDCSWPEEERSHYTYKGQRICYPATSDDFDWANRFLRYKEAWAVSNHKKNAQVIVGHPDSGYSIHPEIYENFLTDRARNFVEDEEDAEDTFTGAHHGHGTSTGSLIASPESMQRYEFTEKHLEIFGDNPENAPFVEGIAPESKIISYRVMNGNVIRFSFKNLTKAIKQAIRDDVGVISISLGGALPMPWLHRAIKQATRAGIIIVAASGNYIPGGPFRKFVVWPANYKETVGVAASDPDGKPWKHSSKGRRIDITAPGAGVWVARAKYVKHLGKRVKEVTRGSGTSFSTAYVAGAASLWLSHHGQDFLKNTYGPENVPWVFKYLLKNHAYNRPEGWDTKKYGPGILDVYKLVTAPLPDPSIFLNEKGIASANQMSENLDNFKNLFERDIQDKVIPTLMKVFKFKSEEEMNRVFDKVGFEINTMFSRDAKLVKKFTRLAKSKRVQFSMRAYFFKKSLKKREKSDALEEELKLLGMF